MLCGTSYNCTHICLDNFVFKRIGILDYIISVASVDSNGFPFFINWDHEDSIVQEKNAIVLFHAKTRQNTT